MVVGDKLEVVEFEDEKYQAVDGGGGSCFGCAFVQLLDGCNQQKCTGISRTDGREVKWIKLEKEQPVSKPDTIKEIRTKALTLQSEIYKLIEAFETDTGMVVRGVDLAHVQEIGGNSETYGIELDVRLN